MGHLKRVFEIYIIIMKNALDLDLKHFKNLWILQIPRIFFPNIWLRSKKKNRAIRLRESFEALGPIFVKFGQTLSTRKDLLPKDIAFELAKLQDRVPPFDGEVASKVISSSLSIDIDKVFEDFNTTPLASASVAQVHTAKLNGNEVVVKVLRPGIKKQIKKDIQLLFFIAKILNSSWSEAKRLKPVEVVEEYEKIIYAELDLLREASNASLLKRNFEGSNYLYVPEVYWDYTTENVMVMERIFGIQISDKDNLLSNNINIKKLAEKGVEIFFTQVFQHNFFHADMHPGNIFISYENPDDPIYCAVDFGIMGSLSKFDQKYLALNFLAFFERDYRKVAELHIDSSWVSKNTRVDEFEAAIRSVCEPIFEKPLSQISFGNLLLRLFSVAREFNMTVQPQLVLLQKTLLNIEGLGRDLYPDLDLWKTAKPFFERWVKENMSIAAAAKSLINNSPKLFNEIAEFPRNIEILKNKIDDDTYNKITKEELKLLKSSIKKNNYMLYLLFVVVISIIFSRFII